MAHSYRQDLKDQVLADANGPATVPKEGATNAFSTITVSGQATTGSLNVTENTALGNQVSVPETFPTADPLSIGVLWNNAGTLKVSAG